MFTRIFSFILILIIGLFAGYWYGHNGGILNAKQSEKLITQATQGQAAILSHFDAYANLEGYIIQSKTGQGPSMIVYTDRSGRYLIAGNVFNDLGINLAQQDYSKYIAHDSSAKAYQLAQNTAWIQEGSATAPRQMYVVADPNCRYCHDLYQALQPSIQSGQLAVRWIIVGFLKPTSTGRAIAILSAQNPAVALAENEAGFNNNKEEGGIAPLKNADGQAKLDVNMHFMQDAGIMSTPTLLYRTTDGSIKMQSGMPNNVDDLINSVGSGS